MKGVTAGLLLLLLGTSWAVETGDYRVFTAKDGLEIEARIIDINSLRGTVQIERQNGMKAWVNPDVFDEKDQEYINNWLFASQFMSNSKLRIVVDKIKKSAGKAGDDVRYVVTFQNRAKVPFENLKVDYRFYIKGKGYQGRDAEDRCVAGTLEPETILPNGRVVCETPVERLPEEYETRYEEATDAYGHVSRIAITVKVRDYDARGLWLRINGGSFGGNPLIRDVMYPDDLSDDVEWIASPRKISETSTSDPKNPSSSGEADALMEEGEKYLKGMGVEADPAKAMELFEKAYALAPDAPRAVRIGKVYVHNSTLRDYAKAEEWMDKAAGHGSCIGYNSLALIFSTNKNSRFHNGELAVKFALKAVEVEGEEDWLLDTLACAYARNGQFELAVKTEEKAYTKAKLRGSWPQKELDAYKERLECFRQGKAWEKG